LDPLIEKLIEVWGTPERGERLWQEWLVALGDLGPSILDRMVEVESEERGISVDEARHRLAIEKMVQDRGLDHAAKLLHHYDAAVLRASHTLKPMRSAAKKRR
jgi:hypothetical protein